VAHNKTYTVYASSQREKDIWIQAMNSVINALVAKHPELLGRVFFWPQSASIVSSHQFTCALCLPLYCILPEKRAAINLKQRGLLSWLSESVGLTYAPKQVILSSSEQGSVCIFGPANALSSLILRMGLHQAHLLIRVYHHREMRYLNLMTPNPTRLT